MSLGIPAAAAHLDDLGQDVEERPTPFVVSMEVADGAATREAPWLDTCC